MRQIQDEGLEKLHWQMTSESYSLTRNERTGQHNPEQVSDAIVYTAVHSLLGKPEEGTPVHLRDILKSLRLPKGNYGRRAFEKLHERAGKPFGGAYSQKKASLTYANGPMHQIVEKLPEASKLEIVAEAQSRKLYIPAA